MDDESELVHTHCSVLTVPEQRRRLIGSLVCGGRLPHTSHLHGMYWAAVCHIE